MKNMVRIVSTEEARRVYNQLSNDREFYVGKIDGKEAQSKREYIDQVSRAFKIREGANYDGFSDWFSDLMWIEQERMALFIFNYDQIVKNDINVRKIMLKIIATTVEWWELYSIEQGGGSNPREFQVYLAADDPSDIEIDEGLEETIYARITGYVKKEKVPEVKVEEEKGFLEKLFRRKK